MNKYKILICGYGNIGKHIEKEFQHPNIEIDIFDLYKSEYNIIKDAIYYDFIFICVPTEKNLNGSVNILEVTNSINKFQKRGTTIVIKSTIPVRTAKRVCHHNIVFSPEFYGTTQHSFEQPDFLIAAGNKKHCDRLIELYKTVKNAEFRFILTDPATAALAKYMDNCWIASKVTFCNEFATIADGFNVDYNELRECFLADKRINPSHTFVYKDEPYFNSHCLNKDVPGLIYQCEKEEIKTPLMKKILKIRNKRSKKKNG